MTDDVTGNFDGQQFAEKEVSDKVVEQYDELQARVFYKYVMGEFECLTVVFVDVYVMGWSCWLMYSYSPTHVLFPNTLQIIQAAVASTFTMVALPNRRIPFMNRARKPIGDSLPCLIGRVQ